MYAGFKGAGRRAAMLVDWGLPSRNGGLEYIVPCAYDPDIGVPTNPSNPCISRHPLNRTSYRTLVDLYDERFEADGYSNDDAGAIHIMPVDTHCTHLMALGGATRVEAFLQFAARLPTHRHITLFIRMQGFRCVCWSHNTPPLLQQLLIEELNDKNDLGCSNTMMQKLESIPKCLNAFTAFSASPDGAQHSSSATQYNDA